MLVKSNSFITYAMRGSAVVIFRKSLTSKRAKIHNDISLIWLAKAIKPPSRRRQKSYSDLK